MSPEFGHHGALAILAKRVRHARWLVLSAPMGLLIRVRLNFRQRMSALGQKRSFSRSP